MTPETPPPATELSRPRTGLPLWRARFVLFRERAWPALAPVLIPPGLLIAISLFDLWRLLPVFVHASLLIGAISLSGWFLFRGRNAFSWPDREAGLARLEADNRFVHEPLHAAEDVPFEQGLKASPDGLQAALWARHRKRMAETATGVRLKGTHATIESADPFALRYATLGLVVLGLMAAGGEWRTRLAGAWQPQLARSEIADGADLWIDPPAYTGKAPVYLLRNGGTPPKTAAGPLQVPAGSTVTALINGRRGGKLDFERDSGGVQRGAPPADDDSDEPSAGETGVRRLVMTLAGPGTLRFRLGAQRNSWPVSLVADRPPVVRFVSPPEPDDKRQISLHFVFDDDYGAAGATLVVRLDPDQPRPLDAPAFDTDALATERRLALEGIAGPGGERTASLVLDEDPWAGLRVLVKVVLTDGAGQTGETSEEPVEIPERPFFNPLAKAVVEQRRDLAVATDEMQRVRDALQATTLLPEHFYEDTAEYLLMRTAFWRVQREKNQETDDIVEHFWPLALELEDKALELARRRLEAALDALRQALENEAGDEVVKQRREDLEAAINDYLQALAQSGQVEPGGAGQNGEQITTNNLEEMLNAIEDLSSSGANGAARQMLSDLENFLRNMRLTQGGGGGGGVPNPGGDGEEGGSMSQEAGELIGKQRDLSDQAFEEGQKPGADGSGLAGEQEALEGAVDDLLQRLEESGGGQQGDGTRSGTRSGTAPGAGEAQRDEARRAFENALREMREAQGALTEDDFGDAGAAMNRAIEELREGAQALARSEAQARRQAEGQNGAGEGADGESGRDPLGRNTTGAEGGNIDVPDTADPARTRDVIEELRRRLGEQGRSEKEIDYLERLLEAF